MTGNKRRIFCAFGIRLLGLGYWAGKLLHGGLMSQNPTRCLWKKLLKQNETNAFYFHLNFERLVMCVCMKKISARTSEASFGIPKGMGLARTPNHPKVVPRKTYKERSERRGKY